MTLSKHTHAYDKPNWYVTSDKAVYILWKTFWNEMTFRRIAAEFSKIWQKIHSYFLKMAMENWKWLF